MAWSIGPTRGARAASNAPEPTRPAGEKLLQVLDLVARKWVTGNLGGRAAQLATVRPLREVFPEGGRSWFIPW